MMTGLPLFRKIEPLVRSRQKILLLIPAFNEEPTIAQVVEGAKKYISGILVVDDGSTDNTTPAATMAGAKVHRLERNMGKGAALQTGFNYALEHDYDWVITMDADGQHDAHDIASFLPLLESYDLLLGNRMKDRACVPLLRRAANLTSSFIVSVLCGRRIYDSQTGFRSYSATLLREVRFGCSHYDLETEAIIKASRKGFRIGHCRIQTIYLGEVSRLRKARDSFRFLIVVAKSFFW